LVAAIVAPALFLQLYPPANVTNTTPEIDEDHDGVYIAPDVAGEIFDSTER
jgi:hypothetical protein